jgi:lipocalin
MRYILLTVVFILLFTDCKSQNTMNTVRELDIEKYLGTWYEIYRLPFYPERNMTDVTATYSLKENGKIKVVNRGKRNGRFKESSGTAWQPNPQEPGKLKVRFFWPFTGDYLVIALDSANYKYSLVTTGSGKYLWFLSKEPGMPDTIVEQFKTIAIDNGIDLSELIEVKHNRQKP